jgi:uncharacterized protein (TIGR03089 family)
MPLPCPARTGSRPGYPDLVLTYFDDKTGERTELSAADLGALCARTASLLRDGCGLGPGSRAAILLPPHWLTAAVLLGSWSTGIVLSLRPAATAGLPPLGVGEQGPFEASFVARSRFDDWFDDIPDARHRYSLLGEAPPGYLDLLSELSLYAESPPPYGDVHPTAAATIDGTSHESWAALARSIGESLGLRAGDRLLVDAAEHENPMKWLLAPLLMGASVVVCANLDPGVLSARIRDEGVTHVL